MKQRILNNIKVIVLATILAVGASYAYAQTWTGPTATPPAGNTPAPVNVGMISQTKTGSLIVGGFRSLTDVVVDGVVQIKGGNPAANKVLVATSATGTAVWKNLNEIDDGSNECQYTTSPIQSECLNRPDQLKSVQVVNPTCNQYVCTLSIPVSSDVKYIIHKSSYQYVLDSQYYDNGSWTHTFNTVPVEIYIDLINRKMSGLVSQSTVLGTQSFGALSAIDRQRTNLRSVTYSGSTLTIEYLGWRQLNGGSRYDGVNGGIFYLYK